jgi:parvulin-like peptidyl-prolyl isomerase
MILITGAANGSKAADDAGIQRRVTFVKDKVLMERVIDNINKNAVTESTMRKAYDEIAANMAGQEEFHVSSILVRIPADATAQTKNGIEAKINAAAERVRKGEDFGTVAKEVSEDPTSRQRGGDFGYLGKHQMEPKFFEVVARLGDGQVSEVFATESGWMIAKVMGRRLRQVPPYDQVQSQVEAYVKGRAQFVLVEKLRAEAKIERLDKPQDAKP